MKEKTLADMWEEERQIRGIVVTVLAFEGEKSTLELMEYLQSPTIRIYGILADLVKEGAIKREGTKYTTKYAINSEFK
jgi:hypothetical protein